MRSLSGQSEFIGLDLGVTAVRVVQLKKTNTLPELVSYGWAPIEGTLSISDSKADHSKLAAIINELFKKTGITSRNVAANLPSNKVFTTVIDMDRMGPEDLAKTIRFQADSFIPTPLAESKADWAVIGDSPKDPKKIEVLLSSVPNNFIEARLEMLESMGLNVVAFEPDSMAFVRALVPPTDNTPSVIIDLGAASTDLVVCIGQTPHLLRSVPIGQQAIIQAAVQQLAIDPLQAQQFVERFGLGKDKLEGQIYNAIMPVIESLAMEVDKSIKFFMGRYPAVKLERIIVTEGASTLPEFPLYLANRFGLNVEIGNSWRNVIVAPAKQNDAASVSNQFAVAAGLAGRS